MDIKQRLELATQKYDQKSEERQQHLASAEECMTEMTKLQGEYRLLNEIQVVINTKKGIES